MAVVVCENCNFVSASDDKLVKQAVGPCIQCIHPILSDTFSQSTHARRHLKTRAYTADWYVASTAHITAA